MGCAPSCQITHADLTLYVSPSLHSCEKKADLGVSCAGHTATHEQEGTARSSIEAGKPPSASLGLNFSLVPA